MINIIHLYKNDIHLKEQSKYLWNKNFKTGVSGQSGYLNYNKFLNSYKN